MPSVHSKLKDLNIRQQHRQPKEKSLRTLKNVVRELVSKFGSYPTEQICQVLNAVLSNLGRDEHFDTFAEDVHEVAFECLKSLKGCSTSLGSDVRAIIGLCLEPELRALPREKRRELGIYERTFARMDEIREDFIAGEFSFLKRAQPRRKSRVMKTNLPEKAEEFLDENSTPIKFSDKGLRVLHFPFRQCFRLFEEQYEDEMREAGGFSLHHFRNCRKERHLDVTHASLYNCKVHVLAQEALKQAKKFMQRLHVPAHCNDNACKKCKFIEDFPERRTIL